MDSDLRIDIQGLEETLAKIDKLERRADDLTPAWNAVEDFMHRQTMARFKTSGQGLWPALKHPHPGPMLVKTGHMRDSIKYIIKKQLLRQYIPSTRKSILGVPYAWYQQMGSQYKRYMTYSQAAKAVEKGLAKVDRNEKLSKYQGTIKDRSGLVYVGKSGMEFDKKTRTAVRKESGKREQAGRGGLLPRPFLFLYDSDIDAIGEAIYRWLDGAFDGPGATL